jgi:MFS family permease
MRAGHAPGQRRSLLRQALRYSFLEGAFSVVMFGLLQTFAVPALMALGAAEIGVANLTGLAALSAGLIQLAAPRLASFVPSRRVLVVRCVLVQAGACVLLAGTGFLPAQVAIPAAVLAYAFYGMSGSVANGPWASWMSDLIPASIRGRYFAQRGLWLGLIHGSIVLGTGYVLHLIRQGGDAAPWWAFAGVFIVAAACRVASGLFLRKQYEPQLTEPTPAHDFTYWQFLAKVRESNFTRFVVGFAFLNAAAFFAGAFSAVYVLRDLRYGYGTLAFLSIVSLASSLFFVRFWGRVSDRYGNRFVLRICALSIVPIPLIYATSTSIGALAAAHAIGGAVWSGFGLSGFNYVMEAATPKRRVRCFAYMNVTVGVLAAAAAIAGGEIAIRLPVVIQYRLQTLFLISAGLRIPPAILLAFGIRQLSEKPEVGALQLFYELPAVRPTVWLLRSLARPFRRI